METRHSAVAVHRFRQIPEGPRLNSGSDGAASRGAAFFYIVGAMATIVQKKSAVLRKTAAEVPARDFGSARLAKVLADMSAALARERDGVALAAPQIGKSLCIFIVSGKILRKKESDPDVPDLVFINPVLKRASKEKKLLEEGCLSVRGRYGKITRSTRATVGAYDASGAYFERNGSGLMAQIFQHEIDHLNGTLFTDHAKEVWDMKAPQRHA